MLPSDQFAEWALVGSGTPFYGRLKAPTITSKRGAAVVGFLQVVAVLSYLFAIAVFLLALNASDIQFILSGVAATCGTCAAAGAAIAARLDTLTVALKDSSPAPRTAAGPSKEELAGM